MAYRAIEYLFINNKLLMIMECYFCNTSTEIKVSNQYANYVL